MSGGVYVLGVSVQGVHVRGGYVLEGLLTQKEMRGMPHLIVIEFNTFKMCTVTMQIIMLLNRYHAAN